MPSAIVRLLCDARSQSRTTRDAATGERPFYWRGSSVRFQLALVDNGQFIMAADIGEITVEVKALTARSTDDSYMRKTFVAADCDETFAATDWQGGGKQLLDASFTVGEAAILPGSYRVIVRHTDGDGEENTFLSAELQVLEPQSGSEGIDPPPVAWTYLDEVPMVRTDTDQALAAVSRRQARHNIGITAGGDGVEKIPEELRPLSVDTLVAKKLKPFRSCLVGSPGPFRASRYGLDRLEDKAFFFLGDSTFFDTINGGLPRAFANRLATQYTGHRVEFRINSADMTTTQLTVLRAGTTRRHWYWSASDNFGLFLANSELAQSPVGADLSLEFEVSFEASALTSGFPNTFLPVAWGGSANGYMRLTFVSNVLALYWSEDNTGAIPVRVASVVPPALTAGTVYRFRADLDIDNGASGRTIRFWYSTNSGSTWTQIGSNVVQAGVTTVAVPAVTGWNIASGSIGSPPLRGVRIYDIQIFSGANRVPLLPWRIDQWSPPEGVATDANPSLLGDPVIYVDTVAKNGASLVPGGFFTGNAAGDFVPNAYRCLRDHQPDFAVIVSSHNDSGVLSSKGWADAMDAAVTSMLARFPLKPAVVHITQNPEPTDYGFGVYSGIHNRRQSAILAYAASRGRTCVDLYEWMMAGYSPTHYTPNNVHPTSAGYAYQALGFWDGHLEGTDLFP